MKQFRDFPRVSVTPKGERSIKFGHPWVYEGEVTETTEGILDGSLADVVGPKGAYLGTGFYNAHSKIRVRLLSTNANDTFDAAFFERRLRYAWELRKRVMGPDINATRLVFGEADGLPGLTVDRFENVLVTETLSLGIEQRKDLIFPALVSMLRADGQTIDAVYERNDSKVRGLEGMETGRGFYEGVTRPEGFDEAAPVIMTENGIRYEVDYQNGQKTGFFLDQKYNRRAVASLAKDLRVLDLFTDTGSFALNCAAAGAKSVTAVDISEPSLQVGRRNAALNGLEDIVTFQQADVFDLLPELEKNQKGAYDLIILDPPAFTKSRKTVESAARGYKEINYRALKALRRGSYFAACSCSHFMTEDLFKKMLRDAAYDAGVHLLELDRRRQAPDHPILWNVPETNYLKFFIFQVL